MSEGAGYRRTYPDDPATGPDQEDSAVTAIRQLDAHLRLRDRGVPILSVLTGPESRSFGALRAWAASAGRDLIHVRGSSADLRGNILRSLAERTLIQGLARARTTALLGVEAEALYAGIETSPRARDVLADRLNSMGREGRLWATFLRSASAEAALGEWAREPEDFIVGYELLAGDQTRPFLLAWLSLLDTPSNAAHEPLVEATGLVESVPSLPLAVVVRPEQLSWVLARFSPHAGAMIVAGRIDTTPVSAECGAELPAPLRRTEPSARVVEAYRGLRAVLDHGGEARSAAEAFLHAVLDEHAPTAGLFELNVRWRAAAMSELLELDLFCRELGLVVELDGYHHFRDVDRYRRDRRRDRILQREGLVVLRFLAEDVLEHLEEILAAVVDLVERRRHR